MTQRQKTTGYRNDTTKVLYSTWNKTRTSKVGAISKAQKAQKTFFEKKLKIFFFEILSNFFFEKPKNLSDLKPKNQFIWRAKRGTLPKLSTFLLQLKEEPFGEKTNFRKKVSQCRKTETGDPLGFLNTQCVVKYQRN